MKQSNVNYFVSIRAISFIILSAIILCILIFFNNISSAGNIAYANSETFTITEGMYDNYTDSDYLLNNTSSKITDYANDSTLYRGTSFISHNNGSFNLTASRDDPIVQIVPKELFNNIGDHIYVGKEYGFYVKTVAEKYDYISNGNWQSTVSNDNKKSTVLVFDITTRDNFVETIDRFIVSVSPIFQFEYAYIESDATYFTLTTTAYANKYEKKVLYAINEEIVVPIGPVNSASTIVYGQVEKYYLKDISFAAQLFNEQAPNSVLPSEYYNAADDNGSFFTSYDYTYNGITRKNGEFPVGETALLGLNTAQIVLGGLSRIVSGICPVAGLAIRALKTISTIAGITSFAHDVGSTGFGIYNAVTPSNVSVSSGELTVVPQYTTKAHQLAYYGSLTKRACIAFNTQNEESIWYTNGSDATAYFTVANSASSLDSEYQTRIIREIGIKVIDENGNLQAIESSSYNYINGNPIQEVIQLEKADTVYLLPNGNNYFSFTPQYTSDYIIKIDSDDETTLKVNNVIIPSENNTYIVKLIAGQNYTIQLSNGFSHIVAPLTVEPNSVLTNLNIDIGTEYIVQYQPDENCGMFNASVDSDFDISKICTLSESGILTELALLDDYKAKESVDLFLSHNEIYYIVLKNNSGSTNTNLIFSSLSHEITMDSTVSRAIQAQDNFVYFKCNIPKGGVYDYIFLFSGITNEADTYNFRVLDSNGNTCNVTQFSYGYLKAFSLTPGENYYIGIKSSINKTTTVSVHRSEISYRWKIKQNGLVVRNDSQKTISLKRGHTYQFELWLNDTVKVRLIEISDSLNYQGLSNINNVTGSITVTSDRKDSTSFTLLGRHNEVENAWFDHELIVTILFNTNVIIFEPIDYTNAVKIAWQGGSDLRSIDYSVSGKDENNANFSFFGSGITGLSIDCLADLISKKALNNVRFTIAKATVSSGYLNGTRLVDVNFSISINCIYSRYEVKTVWLVGKQYNYYISNSLQVYNIRNEMSHYRYFDNDIDLGAYNSWVPIPSLECNIYGNNKNLTNLKIIVPNNITVESNYGFVAINNAVILDLNIKGITITSTSGSHNKPWVNVGAFAGYNPESHGLIRCSATGTITVHHNNSRTGGLIGHNLGTIWSSKFGSLEESSSLVNGNGDLGGIAGQNCGDISSYCKVYNARIESYIVYTNRSSGGIVGYNYGGSISSCSVFSIRVVYNGSGNISDLKPCMGIIVGYIVDSNLDTVAKDNASVVLGTLTKNQATNCANGPWGVYGIAINTVIS